MPQLNTDFDPHLLEKAVGAMNLKRTALENAVLEQKQKYLPDIMKMEKEKTEQELETGKLGLETGKINLESLRKLGPSVLSKSWVDQIFSIGPTVTKQSYGNFYNSMMKTANDFGITPPVQLPAPVEISTMTDEDFNKFKTESLTTLKQQIEKMTAEAHKTTAERGAAKTYEQKTIYGPNGATMNVPIEKGTAYAPPAGWSLNEPPKEGANQTREQLTARSLRGDKEATAILDAMDKREKDIGNSSEVRANRQFAVTLRKEFNALPEVKEYNQTVPKIKSMQAAYELSKTTKNFVAVDQALITLFNKLTDPQSVVRESEYARTAENIPLINQIRGKAEKVMKGGAGLTAEERKGLMDMANLMQKGYDDIRQRRMNEYRGYGTAGGLDPNFLVDANTNSPADVMDKLRKANPGVSDADLRAYAKKKGYL